jgi:RNA polymerase sigma factor (sigma-70 family)
VVSAKSYLDSPNTPKAAATTEQANALLEAYFQARTEPQVHRLLNELLSKHASSIIKQVLHRRLHFYLDGRNCSAVPDAEDLYSDVIAELIRRFGELRSHRESVVVRDFRSYVAGVANNSCHDYLRRKYPLRTSLKNKLRYLLSKKPEFAFWETDDGEWLCGLAEWREREWDLRNINVPSVESLMSGECTPTAAALLVKIFRRTGAPLELEHLVTLVAQISGIKDQLAPPLEVDGATAAEVCNQTDASVREDTQIENKFLLQQVWSEISQLPPAQRAALIFSLRDRQGGDIISIILETRIATITQVAETLNMRPDQFLRLWDSMPLDDQTIAAQLGLTRRQVIKLRWSARKTLARRLKAFMGLSGPPTTVTTFNKTE